MISSADIFGSMVCYVRCGANETEWDFTLVSSLCGRAFYEYRTGEVSRAALKSEGSSDQDPIKLRTRTRTRTDQGPQ